MRLAFAAAGVKVVLLEAERIGARCDGSQRGAAPAGRSTRRSRRARRCTVCGPRATCGRASAAPSLDFSAALKRAGVRADLMPQDLILFSRDRREAARPLQREWSARRDGGARGVVADRACGRAAETGIAAAGGDPHER